MRLGNEVNARLSALKAAGYPTSGAELNAWYASVPDNENAALKLGEAFAVLRGYPDERSNEVASAELPLRGEPLTAELKELLAGHVALNTEALAKAREAIALPRSRYPVDLSAGSDALLPHLAKIKSLARTANCETCLAVDAGRSEDVLTGISTVLGLARTLDEEPVTISQRARGSSQHGGCEFGAQFGRGRIQRRRAVTFLRRIHRRRTHQPHGEGSDWRSGDDYTGVSPDLFCQAHLYV
jgi:hypothetical protein